jgi:MFS family permease
MQLVIFRGLQGIGAGIITANAFTIISDLFILSERPKWQGIIASTFGLSSVIGPLLGGFLSDPHTFLGLTTSWRWTFWINVPIGIFSFFIIYLYTPKPTISKKAYLDYFGAFTLTLALVTFILSFDNTEQVFKSFIEDGISLSYIRFILGSVSFISAIFFIGAELRAKEPIMYLSAFSSSAFRKLLAIAAFFGGGFMGAIIYLTQFNQQVYGADATTSGLMLLPMIAGLAVVSIITGRLVSRVGYYKWPMVWGFSIATLSMFLLSYLNADTPYWFEAIIIAMMGMGMGASMPIINIAIQNEFPQSEQGVAASMSQLFRGIGSTIGTALLGTLLANKLVDILGSGSISIHPGSAMDSNTVQAFVSSLSAVFVVAGVLMLLATIVGFSLKNVQLKGKFENEAISH